MVYELYLNKKYVKEAHYSSFFFYYCKYSYECLFLKEH